ncbi:MAG: FG-GAP repeat protein, partial [Myxococcota bacterium]
RDAQGTWSQRAYLKASNTGKWDRFGRSMDLDGDTLVVGADYEGSSATGIGVPQDDDGLYKSGAAYLFKRNAEGVWSQHAYIKAPNSGERDVFGASLAIDGDTLVVGAWGEKSAASGINGAQDDDSSRDSGAAYIYRLAP